MRKVFRGLGLVLGLMLVWGAVPVEAASTSSSQDPAQLSTAAVLFVKVDPTTGTDTIVVVTRQQAGSSTTTGSAITVHLRFYSGGCHLKFDNNVPVTPQGFFADTASHLFGITAPGVVLADFADADFHNPTPNTKFALSAVIIDGNFGAVYERQGSPLVQPNARGFKAVPSPPAPPGSAIPLFPSPIWGGFSNQDIDDWFIGGFTLLQMLCPGETTDLANDMNLLASFGAAGEFALLSVTLFSSGFPVVNVYDAKEVLKRSIHEVPCFCNRDSAFFGDFVDVIASMKAVGLGTFHWETDLVFIEGSSTIRVALDSIGWRVIGDGHTVYWSVPLRRTPGSSAECDGVICALAQLLAP